MKSTTTEPLNQNKAREIREPMKDTNVEEIMIPGAFDVFFSPELFRWLVRKENPDMTADR
jgi:hypothetical protein